MTPEDQNLLKYYWTQFEEGIKQRSEFYNQTVKMILTIPLFVNAGAAIALASFFSNHNPNVSIKLATNMFILGTTLGILTLMYEFFFVYFSQSDFYKYLERNVSGKLRQTSH